ncbi:MAG: hypothetical protein AAF322_14395, partial [Pseudomonadota bacterium]
MRNCNACQKVVSKIQGDLIKLRFVIPRINLKAAISNENANRVDGLNGWLAFAGMMVRPLRVSRST